MSLNLSNFLDKIVLWFNCASAWYDVPFLRATTHFQLYLSPWLNRPAWIVKTISCHVFQSWSGLMKWSVVVLKKIFIFREMSNGYKYSYEMYWYFATFMLYSPHTLTRNAPYIKLHLWMKNDEIICACSRCKGGGVFFGGMNFSKKTFCKKFVRQLKTFF